MKKESDVPEQCIKLSITSHLKNVALVAMAVRGLCLLAIKQESEINRIELCLVEMVNNAIEHAYAGQGHHVIDVIFTLYDKKKITLQVQDYGQSMILETNEALDPSTVLDKNNLSHDGRGLAIVKKIMDEFSYSSDKKSNCFTMSYCLKKTDKS